MASDPRIQTLVADAERSLSGLKQVEEGVQALRQVGLARVNWRQEYRAHGEDLHVLEEVQSAGRALSEAVAAIEAAECRLAEALLKVNPFHAPEEFEAQVLQLARAARPGAASKLAGLIGALLLNQRSCEPLMEVVRDLARLEELGVSRCAESHARASRGTSRWAEERRAVYSTYDSKWHGVQGRLSALVEARRDALRQSHVAGLLAAQLDPVHIERARLRDLLRSAEATIRHASAYEKSAADVDRGAWRQLDATWSSALSLIPFVKRPRPILTEQDLSLARGWSDDKGGGEYQWKAMLSARRAEVIACQLYRELYGEAEDLAILQVPRGGDDRWRYADIDAGGRWIDVKNARRALSSPNSYSEHCVPNFKHDRASRDVVISGFLSPYDTREDEYNNGVGQMGAGAEPVIWLGETACNAIDRLSQQFPFFHGLRAGARGALLPSWLFDYPDVCYRDRDASLKVIVSNQFAFPRREVEIAFGVLAQCIGTESTTTQLGEEGLLLQKRIATCGLSRPVLFLHVLERFCTARMAGKRFLSDPLRRMLFAWGDRHTPLCVCDPLGVIANLLDVLDKVDLQIEGRRFDHFRFSARGVLRGITPDGVEITLIAFCGGWKWLSNGSPAPCGRNPIFLGEDRTCEHCGYLICRECKFCKDHPEPCPGLEARGYGTPPWEQAP